MPYDFLLWQRLKKSILAGSPWSALTRRSQCNPSHKRYGQRTARVESLESRRLLSINAPFHNANVSVLIITGGSESDRVTVSEEVPGTIQVVQITGEEELTTTYNKSELVSVHFHGNEGDDYFTNQTDLAVLATGGDGNDILVGGSGKDNLWGQGGDDQLHGGGGDDNLYASVGNDLLTGGAGNDKLYGADGNDILHGGDGADTLLGEAGDDQLIGGEGADTLRGAAGNDFLDGEGGNDRLEGGDGDDTLLGGSGADSLIGEAGDDILRGGEGNDYLHGGGDNDTLDGGAGNDNLLGSTGDDRVEGGDGDDMLDGAEGRDVLDGGAGRDRLDGGDGNDVLIGGSEDDSLFGKAGRDTLWGQVGNDYLSGSTGDDVLYGGDGADTLLGSADKDRLLGGNGNDRLEGGTGNDLLYGEAGSDLLFGGDGNDFLTGGDDTDSLYGEAGRDYLWGSNGNDYLHGSEGDDQLFGGGGDDTLLGATGNDRLKGGDGVDRLEGGDGSDTLEGEAGNDNLYGQAGDDILLGGEGEDGLFGDIGNDVLVGGAENDFISAGAGADQLLGGQGNDQLYGDSGDDSLDGGDGEDTLAGGTGNDVLLGGDQADLLRGEEGSDALVGGSGSDNLFGGVGDDLLIGGTQIDTLFGESGEDILIGSSTHHDGQITALREVLDVWGSSVSYELRTAYLSGDEASVSLQSHVTVHDDIVADEVYGGADRDWLFLPGALGIYDPNGGHQHGDHSSHDTGSTASHHVGQPVVGSIPEAEGFALIDSLDHLNDVEDYETVHTLIPHAEDASKRAEHIQLFELVKYADVTHSALRSGSWFDPTIWDSGRVPSRNARVLVPVGTHVVYDRVSNAEVFSVRVDGTLSFATDVNTLIAVDTMVVSGTGRLEMGTEATPVEAGVTARVVFTDDGAIDREWDPFGLSRGLITHGSVEIVGAETTSFASATGSLQAGSVFINLASTPVGWQVGDEIVIAGTAAGGGQDEVRRILEIVGNQLAVSPLQYDHIPLESGLEIHIANLTRNVVFESEASEAESLGHLMFMHNRDVHISYASFNNLGRSDKSKLVKDSQVDENWNLIDETGSNPRARYAIHFHRNGTKADSAPATIRGSVVNGGPGWGFVNHSSYVDISNNVAYGVKGSAFVAEAGDEIGSFTGNIALRTTGIDADVNAREFQQDFGFKGEGFWLQGAGTSVTGNVVAGSSGSGYFYYTRGLRLNGVTTEYLAENLDNSSPYAGEESLIVDHVPIKEFADNIAYGSQTGLTVRYHLRDATHNLESVLEDSTFWNNTTGIHLPYTHNTTLRNIAVLSDSSEFVGTGIDQNAVTKSITYDNLRVEGYWWGLIVAPGGSSVVDGGQFANRWNVVINSSTSANREVRITGAPQFSFAPGTADHDPLAENVVMRFNDAAVAGSVNHVFGQTTVLLDYGPYSNRQLYFGMQRADAVPFPTLESVVPVEFVGLTNSELFANYGLAVSGEIAPAGTTSVDGIIGLLGPVI